MQNIKLDHHVQAHVWIDERQQIICPRTETISKELAKGLTKKSPNKRGGLEILMPAGARFFYGLLGAEFIPNDSGSFLLEVLIATNQENIYEQSIASKLDQVRVGLPSEYSQSVIEGAIESLNETTLARFGSGVLTFDQAAHGKVGSSNIFFRHIATTVIQLLMIERSSNTQEVTQIVKTYSLV
jgi:hypothetical protein